MKAIACLLLACLPAVAAALEPVREDPHQVLYRSDDDYATVRENLVLAIGNQGLVINDVADVGGMLERTGRQTGVERFTYHAAEVLQFCSAPLSREMMRIDPANIAFCPYGVYLYRTRAEPDQVYVGYRRPAVAGDAASEAALHRVEALLDTIVREALAW